MNTIQINKFSHLHDGVNYIFCKTDFLLEEFSYINTLNNEVVLISGNSDYVIDNNIFSKLPKNVVKWYAQNALITNDILECIPLGIENYEPAIRNNHGIGYDRVRIKDFKINNKEDKIPSKFIYSNFNVETNRNHRNQVRNVCINTNFIDWDEPTLSLESFFDKILDYEAIVCAQGNGPGDNHRIYETLYMGRIPITFNRTMYDNLHKNFPVVLLEDINLLTDIDYMSKAIKTAKNKTWDKNKLSCDFWIDKIKNKK
jgi:hypothetical protein